MDNTKYKYKIAVASSDGKVINRHFGRAEEFLIIGIDERNQSYCLERRRVNPICEKGNHEDGRLEDSIKTLTDCRYVLVSRVGQSAASQMKRLGVTPMELPGLIEESIQQLILYEELQQLLRQGNGQKTSDEI